MSRGKRAARRAASPSARGMLAGTTGLAIAAAVIAAAVGWAYRGVYDAPFVFDDTLHVLRNPRILDLASPAVFAGTSRPLVQWTLAANHALGGFDPTGYHAFNVAVHVAAAIALFALARRLFAKVPPLAAAAPGLALATALLWSLHPLQTEAVAYVIQRAESLAGLFYLLTLYAVVRSDGAGDPRRWQAAAVGFCLLGMASKPVMATAPLVALALDRTFLAASWREVWAKRRAMYVGLVATLALLPFVLAAADHEWGRSAGFGDWGGTSGLYALSQPGVILHYLRLAFWPAPLCFDYAWPVVRDAGAAVPALIGLAVLVATTVVLLVRGRVAGFAGLWVFVLLAPTSSVIPVADLCVEHRMYLPLAGLAALVVGLVYAGVRRAPGLESARRWLAPGLVVIACVALAVTTARRNEDYRNAITLWRDTVDKRPNNSRAWNNLGLALAEAGRLGEAGNAFETAIRLTPRYADPYVNLGHVKSATGHHEEAVPLLAEAARLAPDDARAHYNYGTVLFATGRAAEAVPEFEAAARLDPSLIEARNNLGAALYSAGRPADAIPQFEAVLRVAPDPDTWVNYGFALLRSGRQDEARAAFAKALEMQPGHPRAQAGLAEAEAAR